MVLERVGTDAAKMSEMLDAAVGLARALAHARRTPWEQLAHKHGLDEVDVGHSAWLSGTVASMPVRVRAGQRSSKPDASITIELPAGLPPGLTIQVAPRDGRGEGLKLGDPVLDGTVLVTCSDAEAARALLRADADGQGLHGALLAVIHGHPGSTVTDKAVTVVADTAAPEVVDGLLSDGLALARMLGELVHPSGAANRAHVEKAPEPTRLPRSRPVPD